MYSPDIREQARELKAQGLSHSQIAEALHTKGYKSTEGKRLKMHHIAGMINRDVKDKHKDLVAHKPRVTYERVDSLPSAPAKGLVMVVIGRPEEVATIAKGIMQ